jgi:sulfate/thiosulfate-binding protein
MKRSYRFLFYAVGSIATVFLITGISFAQTTRTLILGAYTVPKEAYEQEIIPAFQKYWMENTGEKVKFQESYIASGAQARAIIGGFEADIAALSLEGDVDRVAESGLISHDWKAGATRGMVTQSVVVIGFRPDNPKNIEDWEDLTQPGIEILYPNPKTSGGAMWCVNAIYGAALKITETATGAPDTMYAEDLLHRIQNNVKVMDKSGRESVTTFERGIGDAIVTYENEVLLRQMQGREFPFVIPRSTILIENPIAVIDKNVDKHGTRDVAEAFVEFCLTESSQRSFARFGLRPVSPTVAQEFQDKFPKPELLFDIECLGGWGKVFQTIYGPEGVWTRVLEKIATGD